MFNANESGSGMIMQDNLEDTVTERSDSLDIQQQQTPCHGQVSVAVEQGGEQVIDSVRQNESSLQWQSFVDSTSQQKVSYALEEMRDLTSGFKVSELINQDSTCADGIDSSESILYSESDATDDELDNNQALALLQPQHAVHPEVCQCENPIDINTAQRWARLDHRKRNPKCKAVKKRRSGRAIRTDVTERQSRKNKKLRDRMAHLRTQRNLALSQKNALGVSTLNNDQDVDKASSVKDAMRPRRKRPEDIQSAHIKVATISDIQPDQAAENSRTSPSMLIPDRPSLSFQAPRRRHMSVIDPRHEIQLTAKKLPMKKIKPF